ncbi:MAG: AbgT family transporter [Acidobacteriota bacterium]|nr:AbgT family transporter [Acidobacteriota bacterium]
MSGSFLTKIKFPHVFVLITMVIFACAVATWLLPSGQFQRETKEIEGKTRTVVVPGTYTPVEKHYTPRGLFLDTKKEGTASPTSFHAFVSAVPRGMGDKNAAGIIFFIFIIGGAFGILERTGVITATIHLLLHYLEDNAPVLTAVIMLVIAVSGSTLGMGEEFIPLVPIFVIVAQRLGYDRIYGMAMVIVAAQVGFAAATLNPFTLGVAQGIAEIPYISGWEFRTVFFFVCITISVSYLLLYGRRIKQDPSQSLLVDEPEPEQAFEAEDETFTRRHGLILVTGILVFGIVIAGTVELDWWFAEMSGGFFFLAMLAAYIGKLSMDETAAAFVKGMENMVVAALVVGFAKGIEVVLSNAMVLDTIIFYATEVLKEVPRYVAVQGMFLFQTVLNFLIPSGSGQAAVTMPLMVPIAEILNITPQTAVFAFQCGDGFSNLIIPTSGILMSMLALARIPYQKWLRFMLPLLGLLLLTSAVFLTIAVAIDYSY